MLCSAAYLLWIVYVDCREAPADHPTHLGSGGLQWRTRVLLQHLCVWVVCVCVVCVCVVYVCVCVCHCVCVWQDLHTTARATGCMPCVMKYGVHSAHGKPLGQTGETQVKLTGYHLTKVVRCVTQFIILSRRYCEPWRTWWNTWVRLPEIGGTIHTQSAGHPPRDWVWEGGGEEEKRSRVGWIVKHLISSRVNENLSWPTFTFHSRHTHSAVCRIWK